MFSSKCGNSNRIAATASRAMMGSRFEAFFEALAATSHTAPLGQMFDSTVVRAPVSAAGANVGPPRPQGSMPSDLISLRQRIRPQGLRPGHDGDPRVRGPHKGAGVTAPFGAIDFPNTGRLSGHLASTSCRPRCRPAPQRRVGRSHHTGTAWRPLEDAAMPQHRPDDPRQLVCRAPPQPHSGARPTEARATMPLTRCPAAQHDPTCLVEPGQTAAVLPNQSREPRCASVYPP